MARKVFQFRYYGIGNAKNYPLEIESKKLNDGSIFAGRFPVIQLGIQSFPGAKFYLNNSEDPIIIGTTGIYELNVENLTEITGIRFDWPTISTINSNPSAYAIIDILYEGSED